MSDELYKSLFENCQRGVPAAEPIVTAAAPMESGPDRTGIDETIFKEYPDLRSLPPAKFDIKEILTENNKGGYKSGKNTLKVKILKSLSVLLPRILHDGERVVRVAKGTANYPLEVFLGNGFLTMMYNHYAVICTTMRILFINIDGRMKKPTHYLFQMSYHELKKIRRGSIFGSMTFLRKKGKKRVFSGMKRALSKEITAYVTAKISAPPPANPELYIENLCPSCFIALEKGLIGCSSCNAAFKEPKKSPDSFLDSPGLGRYLPRTSLSRCPGIDRLYNYLAFYPKLVFFRGGRRHRCGHHYPDHL
jgi:hypothetical protein